jgi:hypothetical protein
VGLFWSQGRFESNRTGERSVIDAAQHYVGPVDGVRHNSQGTWPYMRPDDYSFANAVPRPIHAGN